ncbi:MAG TPA: IPT/TIG domain-containing protein [Luteibacter sp.]|nr:IPT/TIG domain-containing protein [Luteibacter sp.]
MAFALLLSLAEPASAQEVHYTYDADGRLIAQGPAVSGVAITGFAPAYGSGGVSVSIQGQGFDPVASNNQLSFGGVAAVVDSARPDLLTAKVPASAVTGPIAVVAGGKRAQSATDFVIFPPGTDLSGIVGRATLPIDGVFHPYSSLAGRSYALSYSAASGSYVSVDLNWDLCSGLNSAGLSYKLYSPAGDTLASGELTQNSPTLPLPAAAVAGTYTLLVSAPNAWNCQLAAQLDGKVSPDDSPIHLVTSLPFHTKRILFDVPDGGALGVASSDIVTMPAGGALVMSFNGPSGESAGSYACGYPGYGDCQGQIVYRPAGTYAAILQPYDSRTSTIDTKFWLTNYVDGGAFEPNSTVRTVIEKPGQVVRYTFHGHTGQMLRLITTDRALGPGTWYDIITGKSPAGDCIFDNNYYCNISAPTAPYDFAPLRYDGVYTLFYYLKSLGAAAPTGALTMTLSDTVDTTMPSGADHVDVTSTVNGQQVRVPILVKEGEDVSVALTDINSQPSPFYIEGDLYRPDGSLVTSIYCGTGWGSCFTTLEGAAPGSYYLLLKEADTRTRSFSARVWRVPFAEGGQLSINSTVNVSSTLPGQVVRYTVPASEGQRLHLWLDNVHPGPSGQQMNLTGKNPSGQCIFDNNYYCNFGTSSHGLYDMQPLRMTGNYELLAYVSSNGDQASYGTASITLSDTKAIPTSPGEWSTPVAADFQGQTARGVLHVADGESFTLAATDVLPTNTDGLLINLYAPDGSLARNFYCGYSGGCSMSVLEASAGAWTIEAASMNGYGNTFSTTLWKSEIVDGGALMPGVPLALSVTRPGNLVKVTVSGKAGDSFTLGVDGQVLGAGGGRAGISGRGADGACAFANNYYCDVSNGYTGTIGPLAADSTRDIYFYVSGDGTRAAVGSATVTLTPVH